METDDLIRGLAADTDKRPSLGAGLALALAVGAACAALLFALILRPRSDLSAMMFDPRVLLKFAVTVSLAAAAGGVAIRLSRPGATVLPAALVFAVPAAIMAIGIGSEMAVSPPQDLMPGLIGHNARYCVSLIPLISVPLLAAMLLALKRGAPTRPALAGAAAGLIAGGVGAALYALHCTDDSPFFRARLVLDRDRRRHSRRRLDRPPAACLVGGRWRAITKR